MEVKTISRQKYVPPYLMARPYACTGEKDLAFEWLIRPFQGRQRTLTALGSDPLMDSPRCDPRFAELLLRVGFPKAHIPRN
jgi:hypothetical protein